MEIKITKNLKIAIANSWDKTLNNINISLNQKVNNISKLVLSSDTIKTTVDLSSNNLINILKDRLSNEWVILHLNKIVNEENINKFCELFNDNVIGKTEEHKDIYDYAIYLLVNEILTIDDIINILSTSNGEEKLKAMVLFDKDIYTLSSSLLKNNEEDIPMLNLNKSYMLDNIIQIYTNRKYKLSYNNIENLDSELSYILEDSLDYIGCDFSVFANILNNIFQKTFSYTDLEHLLVRIDNKEAIYEKDIGKFSFLYNFDSTIDSVSNKTLGELYYTRKKIALANAIIPETLLTFKSLINNYSYFSLLENIDDQNILSSYILINKFLNRYATQLFKRTINYAYGE